MKHYIKCNTNIELIYKWLTMLNVSKTEGKKYIQSVTRAVDILCVLANNSEGISLKDIAENVNLGKSTVYHLINTLVQTGLVSQNKSYNKYRLGPRTLEFSTAYLNSLSLSKVAYPILKEIFDEYNENIYLFKIENLDFFSIISLESTRPVRLLTATSESFNAHATATGKVLLSSFSEEELDKFFDKHNKLHKFTENTIISKEEIRKEINSVKEKQYAFDSEELEVGINCIATPIYNHNSKIVASVGMSIPKQRSSEVRRNQLLLLLKKASEKISMELGYKKHNTV